MLLRTPAARRAFQLPTQSSAASILRPAFTAAASKRTPQLTLASRLCTNAFQTSKAQPHIQLRSAIGARTDLFRLGQQRYETKYDKPDLKAEEKISHRTLTPHPELVSSSSTIHPAFSEQGVAEPEQDPDMLRGVRSDIVRRNHIFPKTSDRSWN